MLSIQDSYTREMSNLHEVEGALEMLEKAAKRAVVELGVAQEWLSSGGRKKASEGVLKPVEEVDTCVTQSLVHLRDVTFLVQAVLRKVKWAANERKLDHMRIGGLLEALDVVMERVR
jgi:hypothetical protein